MILALPECGLGDALALTATIRELHLAEPSRAVAVLPSDYDDVWTGNPHFAPADQARRDGVTVALEVEKYGDVGNIAVSFGIQLGVRVTDSTPELYGVEDAKFAAEDDGPRVALDIHARALSRRWHFERWCEVVATLSRMGIKCYGTGKRVPDHDVRIVTDTRSVHGLAVDFTDTLSLRKTAGMIRAMDLFIGMDSGGAHLAAACGIPQVVLYSRSPWYSRAYWNTTPVYHQAPPCPVLCNRDCGEAPYISRCLDAVTPRMVVDGVLLALRRFPRKG